MLSVVGLAGTHVNIWNHVLVNLTTMSPQDWDSLGNDVVRKPILKIVFDRRLWWVKVVLEHSVLGVWLG